VSQRGVAPIAQWDEEDAPASSPTLVYPVKDAGGRWGWSDVGPAEGAIVSSGGHYYVDEAIAPALGRTAVKINGQLLVI
jgi:hypothetical protein